MNNQDCFTVAIRSKFNFSGHSQDIKKFIYRLTIDIFSIYRKCFYNITIYIMDLKKEMFFDAHNKLDSQKVVDAIAANPAHGVDVIDFI